MGSRAPRNALGLVASYALGLTRLVHSMGIHRQLPDRLRQLHPRYGTPWVGILLFGDQAAPHPATAGAGRA